jgi:hypothetical protein
MQICIGFSKRSLFFSSLLQWVEKRPYSHCYISFAHPVTGQSMILQAAEWNIHMVTRENFQKVHKNVIIKEYIFDIPDYLDIINTLTFINKVSGNPYGYRQLFGMALVKLAGFFGKTIKNPLGDGLDTMVCSEFCANVLKVSKILPNIDLSYAEQGGPSWVDKTIEKAGHVAKT